MKRVAKMSFPVGSRTDVKRCDASEGSPPLRLFKEGQAGNAAQSADQTVDDNMSQPDLFLDTQPLQDAQETAPPMPDTQLPKEEEDQKIAKKTRGNHPREFSPGFSSRLERCTHGRPVRVDFEVRKNAHIVKIDYSALSYEDSLNFQTGCNKLATTDKTVKSLHYEDNVAVFEAGLNTRWKRY